MSEKPIQWTPAELTKGKVRPDVVEVPTRKVLSLLGAGDPNSPDFAAAVGTLYGVSYTARFARKKSGLPVFKVGVLEGVWWAAGEDLPTDRVPDRSDWRWRVQMGVPGDFTPAELSEAVEAATTKRGGKLEGSALAGEVALQELPVARMGRILHKGPYSAEAESFAVLETLLEAEGLRRQHSHVEIYLSDPSRTEPEKLKTVLLVPVAG